jgi:hypothetical protein
MVEHLLSKCKALNSNSSTTKNKDGLHYLLFPLEEGSVHTSSVVGREGAVEVTF